MMKAIVRFRTYAIILPAVLVLSHLNGCKEDEEPKTVPMVATAGITDITSDAATGGGEIISDGGAEITAEGICWSSTNALPTIDDDLTTATSATAIFSGEMTSLSSSTTYYVRAYATNSVGTGYGSVVSFMTGNAAPVVTNVEINEVTGMVAVDEYLEALYIYSDSDSDEESGTSIQWYVAIDGIGTDELAIEGATELTYIIKPEDEFKFLRVGITPRSTTGTTDGVEVKSDFVGPVAAPETVTFTYNGEEVTYGVVISSVTGRKWLDRNLGAPNGPTAYDDYANFGDAFQWGRGDDGHQLTGRDSETLASTSVNGTTESLSDTDMPGHNLFILTSASPQNWRNPANHNLWQGVSGVNNPCPSGWRIPTSEEWEAEDLANIEAGFSQLKITNGGYRSRSTGSFIGTNSFGLYWTSTVPTDFEGLYANRFEVDGSSGTVKLSQRAVGYSCRCIKE